MWTWYIHIYTYLDSLTLISFSGISYNCLMWLLIFYLKPHKGNYLLVGSIVSELTKCCKLHCILMLWVSKKSIVLRPVKKMVFLCNRNNHNTWLMAYKASKYFGLQQLSQRYAGDYLIVLVLHFIAPNYYRVNMGSKVTWTLNIWES